MIKIRCKSESVEPDANVSGAHYRNVLLIRHLHVLPVVKRICAVDISHSNRTVLSHTAHEKRLLCCLERPPRVTVMATQQPWSLKLEMSGNVFFNRTPSLSQLPILISGSHCQVHSGFIPIPFPAHPLFTLPPAANPIL